MVHNNVFISSLVIDSDCFHSYNFFPGNCKCTVDVLSLLETVSIVGTALKGLTISYLRGPHMPFSHMWEISFLQHPHTASPSTLWSTADLLCKVTPLLSVEQIVLSVQHSQHPQQVHLTPLRGQVDL